MVAVLVVLSLVVFAQGVLSGALWLASRRDGRVIAGLRKDVEHAVAEIHRRITSQGSSLELESKRLTTAFYTAAVANDRILYYTKHSAILARIGAKYDKVIAAMKAQQEAPAPQPENDAQDSAQEGTAQSEGVAGSIGPNRKKR